MRAKYSNQSHDYDCALCRNREFCIHQPQRKYWTSYHHRRFSTINPGVHIAGHCHIGESVTIGMGALVVDTKKIGRNSIIGAGALVTKDVPENVLVMGSPAKIIKEL
ncbi:MAG: hypothetical protein HC912_02305 [Saprospiraceae bacterium]|nr:hypothetical protein [Saprospiraceae bacterium]